jgi:phage tail sheath protein FI
VRWANHRAGVASNTASNLASVDTVPLYASFHNGQDGDAEDAIPLGRVLAAYDLFASTDDVDVALVMTGKSRGGTNGEQIANYLVDNIAEVRKDCIVLASPEKADVVNNNNLDEASDTVTFRNSLRSSSYLVIDSGYKYQYDKYNDVFRYVPLNGDIAGLCVRTDATRDPWFSPAGFNRGQIKNLVKLAYNPDKADRDLLYKNGINPVATFPGQGTVLFGDKTALSKPSAFDRINVRRLFIVLEKAIATAAKFSLFEFNDEFTRAQFVSLVEPFLRDVQGRRGIYDYRVVCDNTNNTGEVVDRNEFVGDIYIKPAKSINFIQLNFVAVRTGVAFDEIVGKF